MKIPYTLTSEAVTLVVDGKPMTFQKGTPNFEGIRKAVFNEDWEAIPKFLTTGSSIEQWAKGEFTVQGEVISYKGSALPDSLSKRIVAMAGGGEDPTPLFKFWERLQKNPSWRSVGQLWGFLEHRGIPLTEDGCFLAYKSVTGDFKDCHTRTINNNIGTKHVMERNLVSDDPDTACHYGFHVGALEYARSFGGVGSNIIICKVDPADVVCVPKDSSQQKMRVCAYEVVGHHAGGYMPSTVLKEDFRDEQGYRFDEGDEDASGLEEEPEEDEEDLDEDGEDEDGEECPRPPKKERKLKASAPAPDASLFMEMDKEDGISLMKRDIATLRRYAALHMKIVGASKIIGGKPALMNQILLIRSKN